METPVKNLVDAVDLTADDALLPLFECIANSIISLKQSKINKNEKKIIIQISRGKLPNQPELDNIGTISSIKITDNGIGFDKCVIRSIQTSDPALSDRRIRKHPTTCSGIIRA